MRRQPGPWMLVVAMLLAAGSADAAGLAGRYVAAEDPALVLTLTDTADGGISGTLTDPSASVSLSARRQGESYAGTLGTDEEALPMTASVQGELLVLQVGATDEGERLTFRLSEAGSEVAAAPAAGAVARNVVFNGRRYTEAELAALEQAHGIRIPDANYWYDGVLGAWGVEGSPTLGLIAPGLELGGPLRADASGGGTNVVVNGRVLHPLDLAALQQLTGPVLPGRYFITAQGLAGPEGGPPMWDLGAMARQAQGGGGGSSTWQGRVTGSSGFSDGTTGAVFLPNGGIVSTGQ
jgi:hypothetical protein